MDRYDKDGKKLIDDFNWKNYTNEYYLKEIDNVMEKGEMYIFKDTFIKDGEIIEKDGVHFNSVNICKDILKYRNNIKNVFECGCSCGYHLYNIKHLFPEIDISGCELLESQVIKAGSKLNIPEDIINKIIIKDFLKYNIDKQIDYVFTNAVIMHLTFEKAIRFINNILEFKPLYIRMNENLSAHNWNDLFKNTNILEDYNMKYEFFFIKNERDIQ